MASVADGQTPATTPLAVFDEATLQQAGVETEAAGLLTHLDVYLRTDGDSDKLQTLLAQLGHAQFEQREHAAQKLLGAGRPALEPLRQAHKKHDDPEVRRRAGDCLAMLPAGEKLLPRARSAKQGRAALFPAAARSPLLGAAGSRGLLPT